MIGFSEFAKARPSRAAIILVTLVLLAILGIMAERAVTILSHAGHDDLLYMRQALSLVRFKWLGAYNELTLVKGPGLSALLAIGHLSGLPFPYVQLGTMLFSLMVFSWTVACFLKRSLIFPLLALILMLTPSLYASSTARMVRESLFISLTFLFLAALIASITPTISSRKSWMLGGLGGLALGALWLTREEGVTVLPMIALFGLAGFLRLRESGWQNGDALSPLKPILAAMITFVLVLGIFASINALVYGQFIVNENKGGAFPRAMSALQRASYMHWRPFLPVSRAARVEIYRESPTFNRLRLYLDPENAPSPWSYGCTYYKSTCGDIAGGWWIWALRAAAASVGAHSSPKTAAAFYNRLANEIDDACASGRLTCAGWQPPLIPPMTREQWRELPARLWRALDVFAMALPVAFEPHPSVLTPEWRGQLLGLLNRPLVATNSGTRSMLVSGWYWRTGGGFLNSEGVEGGTVPAMERRPSPDVAAAVASEAREQRFAVRYDCPTEARCLLRLAQDGGAGSAVLDLSTLQPGALALGDGHLQIDVITQIDAPLVSIRTKAYRSFVGMLDALVPIYRALCFLGAAAFLIAFIRHRRAWFRQPALLLATVLLSGVLARAAALALIDLTSFPTLYSYLYPASGPPLLVAFAVLSIAAAVTRRGAHAVFPTKWRSGEGSNLQPPA